MRPCSTTCISLESSSTIFFHCKLNTEVGFRTSEKPSRQNVVNRVFRMFFTATKYRGKKKNLHPQLDM